jgi:hypothetical protein
MPVASGPHPRRLPVGARRQKHLRCHAGVTNPVDAPGSQGFRPRKPHRFVPRGRQRTVLTTCARWCPARDPGSGLVGVLARQSGTAASLSCLRSRVHTFICHDLSHVPCETSTCLRCWKQVRHVPLQVPLLRRLHVRVPGPPGEQVIWHIVVGEYVRRDARASYRRVRTGPPEALLRWLPPDPKIACGVEPDALVRWSGWACDVGSQVESGSGDRIGHVRLLVLSLRPFVMCAQQISDSPDRTVPEVRGRRFLAHGW